MQYTLAKSVEPARGAPLSTAAAEGAFIGQIRTFLAEALTTDLRGAGRRTIGVHSGIGACRIWHRRLFVRGWIAPAWPRAYGGTGWTARQRFLFERECARADAPVLFASGLRSLGPLLIELGTDAHRRKYLPAILSGDDLWCQGFSEPGAGSDLAAIATRAVRSGAVYEVTGSKIWTTGAHLANRMFAIVRTADGPRRQEGLTFLLIDMDSPGITVRPITGLAGEHEFNQVFFDRVRVPVGHRVGAENDGWSVAKRLMQLARSNNTPAALVRRALRRAFEALAAAPSPEPALRSRLAELSIELDAFEQLELASIDGGAASSMLKLVGSELHQKICELTMMIAGPGAAQAAAPAMARHLAVRAASIYSGTSETQRNLLARQLLAG